jgi:hypothetical protein
MKSSVQTQITSAQVAKDLSVPVFVDLLAHRQLKAKWQRRSNKT